MKNTGTRILNTLLLICLMVGGVKQAQAQHANDEISTAREITMTLTPTYTATNNTGALMETVQPPTPDCDSEDVYDIFDTFHTTTDVSNPDIYVSFHGNMITSSLLIVAQLLDENEVPVPGGCWIVSDGTSLLLDPNKDYYIRYWDYNGNGLQEGDFEVTVYSAQTLPLELKSQSVRLTDETSISYEFETSAEINLERIILEESTDGIEFTVLTRFDATNSIKGAQYMYTHRYSRSEITETHIRYYRLTAVDLDGKREYFPLVSLLFTVEKPSYLIQSNGISTTIITLEEEQQLQIIVYTMRGQLVLQQKLDDQVVLDTTLFAPGQYILLITTITGEHRGTERVVFY